MWKYWYTTQKKKIWIKTKCAIKTYEKYDSSLAIYNSTNGENINNCNHVFYVSDIHLFFSHMSKRRYHIY